MIEYLHIALLSLVVCRESQHANRALRVYARPPLSRHCVIELLPVTPFLYYVLQLSELTGRSLSA